MDFSTIVIPEAAGTAMLVLLGCGVVANVVLPRTKGFDGGWLLVNFGWGLAVFAGVYVAFSTGAHINPAVTFGIWASGAEDFYVPPEGTEGQEAIPVTAGNGFAYIFAQMLGACIGAIVVYLAYKKHFDQDADPASKLAVFSTGPAIRSYGWNLVTEIVGTFVLVFVILHFAKTPSGLGPLAVALLVLGIGASLGGPTGYAINPARDLGPRIAHALLPIKGKGSSDWSYAWVPVLGPILGGVLGGLAAAGLTS
ncbi:major intrinsic protein [Beutenbergia cavernae DSM 12333]|uniref:Major intrinsic protein n=1 Tax=Beutenbergia cavernae (strain ATCC BAA-8 / DSM 12333 / CCUG 43141 / JCM 11478 / NBRC 16432 / NCIMB 13614 / HKI 0122) TaxID=471853 RepID=C5C1C3_BEUC1|nr:MIP/aquaporin family protein [Beutenbergia cavernae]ACQ81533.1 major intrinsic protein [Beutenbergia cavernae DSM 12333]